jgi:hypothetical protein
MKYTCAALLASAVLTVPPSSAWAGPTTAIRSWTPAGIEPPTYKLAAACHDIARDVYGVAVVFEIFDEYLGGTYDEVYYLRINGNTASPTYGELLGATWVASEWRVDNIDCTSDDANNVYLAFDRKYYDSVWYRVDGATFYGPYPISNPDGFCGFNISKSHRPRISYAGGATPRIAIAFEGHRYDQGTNSCEACMQQFNPATGAVITGTDHAYWPDNMLHGDYDVEWNGNTGTGSRFVWVLPVDYDAGSEFLVSMAHNGAGVVTSENTLQAFSTTPSPAYPQGRVRLVYSRNAANHNLVSYRRFFLQTDTGNYWLNSIGALVGAPQVAAAAAPFAACEYWGADQALATRLTPVTTATYVGTWPFGYFMFEWKTLRAHYGLSPGAAYETSYVNNGYYPEACDGANTTADPEVFVVSSPAGGADESVYWNILSND